MNLNNFKRWTGLLLTILIWQLVLAPLAQAAPVKAIDQCPEPPCVFNPGPGPAGPSEWQPSPGGANQQESFPGNRPSAPDQFNSRTPNENSRIIRSLLGVSLMLIPVLNLALNQSWPPRANVKTVRLLAGVGYYLSWPYLF